MEFGVAILQTGPVTTGTRQNLVEGVRASAMPQEAVDAVFAQASEIAEMFVELYGREVAAGEVGEEGSGRASDAAIVGEPPRALLYGRIQSGKTVSMILSSALCLDNGFRVVVVLTTDNVALVKQTAGRFKDLDGPRVFAAIKDGPTYEWMGQEDELREAMETDGIVLVCAKNSFNLPEVIRFLQQLDASNYPVLVLDDEADAATLDTTLAARSASKPNAPAYASTINRLVIQNDRPDEEGFSLGEILPHSLYVQVTATPYILFLQREASNLRPSNTYLLEPGIGYCGGEVFFGDFEPEMETPPVTIALVDDNENALMKRSPPLGLARSVNFFIISACAWATTSRHWPSEGFKHLSHQSHRTDEHEIVAGYIEKHLNLVRATLKGSMTDCLAFFSEAYTELTRSVASAPALEDLVATARSAMRHAEIFRVNSKADAPAYGPRLNFLVGGNILGRGLTIDDLLVTYYVREAKTSQMDTVWQHARMYGYRRRYLDHTRVFLPRRLAVRFKEIHEAEEALRKSLGTEPSTATVLIRVPEASRPTRPNAIEAGVVRAIASGRDQVHPHFLKEDTTGAAALLDLLIDNQVPVGEGNRSQRTTKVPFDVARQLVDMVPVSDDDPGLWSSDTITALLNSFSDELQAGCVVYVREVGGTPPAKNGWFRGRLNGTEINLLRDASGKAPSIALLYAGAADAPSAWYPTIVMPADAPAYVFTAS
jgi:hypothetical protein